MCSWVYIPRVFILLQKILFFPFFMLHKERNGISCLRNVEAVKMEVQKEPNSHFFGYKEVFKILEIDDSY